MRCSRQVRNSGDNGGIAFQGHRNSVLKTKAGSEGVVFMYEDHGFSMDILIFQV